jgi:hypothetical protein
MIDEIIIDMVSDYVEQEFDLLPEKDVLFKNGIVDMAPKGIESALRNMKGAGERIQMPAFKLDDLEWQNIKDAPTEPGKVDNTAANAYTYDTYGLTMLDEWAIKVWRRQVYEYSMFNEQRRVWGKSAEIEIARQLSQGSMRQYERDLHYVLRGSIPAANYFDETAQNEGGQSEGARYINPKAVVAATQSAVGDKMNRMTLMIMHSKVWADYKKTAYGNYSNATLLTNMEEERESIWLVDNKIIYVTDRCENETSGTDEATYNTYILAQNQLQLARTEAFKMVADPETARHEQRFVRANLGFVPHLKGMSYKEGAPKKPTATQLADRNNWEFGRYKSASQILAAVLVTN